MPKLMRFILISVCIASLAALFSAQAAASGSNSDKLDIKQLESSVADAQTGDPEAGAGIYKAKCARCHGSEGAGGFAPGHVGCHLCNDYPTLTVKIEKTMPKGDSGSCVGECASDTAAYIFVRLNGNSF